MAKIDFANLQSEKRYSPMSQAYAQSKLADSLFALELQRRLTRAGSPVIATSAHPGYAITNLQTSGPGTGFSLLSIIGAIMKPLLSQDAAHGALPTLFAAAAPQAVAGGYYGPDGPIEAKGYPKAVFIPSAAKNANDAERLWSEAEKLTGTPFQL
jgi:NAD(P)-dependent dehydrogenase (short-subunit alcohol dehydrogenase family)